MKKRFKYFFLLIFLGIIGYLVYCNYTIRGTWIRTHEYNSSGNRVTFMSPSVVSFSTFEVQTFEPDFERKFTSHSFLIIGKTILSNADFSASHKIPIKHIDSDSIVFKNASSTFVYRKVPDSLKEPYSVNFTNRLFEMKVQNIVDTSYFTEKEIFVKSKTPRGYEWSNAQYGTASMNGFQFFGGDFGAVFAIKKFDNQYRMYGFSKDSISFVSVREIPMTPQIKKEVELAKENVLKEREYYEQQLNKQ